MAPLRDLLVLQATVALASRVTSHWSLDQAGPWFATSCSDELPGHGSLERWVTVKPGKTHKASALGYVDPTEWTEPAALAFQPFVLRGREHYEARPLIRVHHQEWYGNGTLKLTCEDMWFADCADDAMSFQNLAGSLPACTGEPNDRIALTRLKTSEDFCSRNFSSGGYYLYDVEEYTDRKVFILDGPNGTEHLLAPEQCATLSTMSPAKGIMLEDLDSDLMGEDLSSLSSNGSKVKLLMEAFNKQSDNIQGYMHDTLEDLNRTAEAVASGNLSRGSSEVMHTSIKWIKGAVLASEVESCLCCDVEEVGYEKHMADHCKVAYTLGGQNSSNPFAYTFQVTAGTLYEVSQQAGNWVVPFMGKSMVRRSNQAACQYACDMRMPHLFEPYAHGTVRNVPGVAMRSWFLTAA